ncbi:hypothetical protein [Micromonospora sp. URMC 103]
MATHPSPSRATAANTPGMANTERERSDDRFDKAAEETSEA